MQQQETELTGYLLGEVNNNTSNDYLQNFYFTHKCVDGDGTTWYKAHTDYTVENTTALWFKEAEVSWFEDVE
mgnify:CR=1 FL=1